MGRLCYPGCLREQSFIWLGKGCLLNLPRWKTGTGLRASVLAPEGTDFDYMDKVVMDVTQKVIDSVPERYHCIYLLHPALVVQVV